MHDPCIDTGSSSIMHGFDCYRVAMILLLDIQSLLAEVLPSFFLLIMVPAFEPLAQGTAGLI
jgi:hypothetical protein